MGYVQTQREGAKRRVNEEEGTSKERGRYEAKEEGMRDAPLAKCREKKCARDANGSGGRAHAQADVTRGGEVYAGCRRNPYRGYDWVIDTKIGGARRRRA
jgi:hypothetical protein